MQLNNWPEGTVSNKDWSADLQDDQQNPQKRSEWDTLLTPCYILLHPVIPTSHPVSPPLHPALLPLHTTKSPIYPVTPRYTLLHTVTSMLHPRRGAASNFCVLVLLSSSSPPQNYGFYGPQIGSTCQVHLVKFPILISRTFQRTICSCWRGGGVADGHWGLVKGAHRYKQSRGSPIRKFPEMSK